MPSKHSPAAAVREDKSPISDPTHGNAMGGRGGPEDELLIDGQEEVFSRSEVELGRIEHKTGTPASEPSPWPGQAE